MKLCFCVHLSFPVSLLAWATGRTHIRNAPIYSQPLSQDAIRGEKPKIGIGGQAGDFLSLKRSYVGITVRVWTPSAF